VRPAWAKLARLYLRNNKKTSLALVAHTCNPSYSRGRDQEDGDSKPAWAKSSQDPISKKPFTHTHTHTHTHTKTGGIAQGVGPKFKLRYCKKN
jgi:hypothetical protein